MTVQDLEIILSEVKDKSIPVIFSTFSMHEVEDIQVEFAPKDNEWHERLCCNIRFGV